MEPTRAPWAKPPGQEAPPPRGGGAAAAPMEQTRAPWARDPAAAPAVPAGRAPPLEGATRAPWAAAGAAAAAAPLPAVSRGELTKAPWASGPALTGRPVEAAVPDAAPRLPPAPPPEHDWSAHRFAPPAKRIAGAEHLKQFLQSAAARDFVSFLLALNEAVKGRQLSDPCEVSDTVQRLVGALDKLWALVDATPPAAHTLRYGNPAYRTWFARMAEGAEEAVAGFLPGLLRPAATELAGYWADSFGNATRIDYGTGHETTFAALLYCLARLGAVGQGDAQALVTRAFARYLQLMRKIQTTYWLEPAGSHGVWGLDDYQFLPFVWGSAQLVDHPFIRPASIHSRDVLEGYASEYLYLGAVRFAQQVKKGPLQETSPMLCDIGGVPLWSKVNSGMVKMYQAEVLAKWPIMQHFLLGTLLDWRPGCAGSEGAEAGGGGAAAAEREQQAEQQAEQREQQAAGVQ